MFPYRPKTRQLHEATDIVFADPVGFNKLRPQSHLAGYFENRCPGIVVVDHYNPRFVCAMPLDAVQRAKNIDSVENVVKQDVIEIFIQVEVFGIALNETEIGMLALCILDHCITDLNPNTIFWPHRCKEMARLTANIENTFTGLNNELQQLLKLVVKIVILLNIPVSLGDHSFLVTASSIADFGERARSPCIGLYLGLDYHCINLPAINLNLHPTSKRTIPGSVQVHHARVTSQENNCGS